MKKLNLIVLLFSICVLFSACSNSDEYIHTNTTHTVDNDTNVINVTPSGSEDEDVTKIPEVAINYIATIVVEDYGEIVVELDSSVAPKTVTNFVKLAQDGFYNGLTFHRIMEGFMIQGGCPYGTGTGGSDENIYGEFSSNGFENNLSHTRGVISMARSQDKNSASSQFFIVHKDSPHLDGDYAAFGEVIKGMDVVDLICSRSNPVDNNGTILPEEQPMITSIIITIKE